MNLLDNYITSLGYGSGFSFGPGFTENYNCGGYDGEGYGFGLNFGFTNGRGFGSGEGFSFSSKDGDGYSLSAWSFEPFKIRESL